MYYNDYNRLRDEEPIVTNNYTVDGKRHAKKKISGKKLAAVALACTLLGGVGGWAAKTVIPVDSTTLTQGSHPPVAVSLANVTTEQPLTLPQVYANNVEACVGITTELVTTNYWGQKVTGAAAGSGFIISADGYILTNYHVIDGASSIKVAFLDGSSYDATLVGGEEDNDIAVLKIEASGLQTVTLGDSDNLVVGEQVAAIGNPLGELTFTLTSGYVSARDRSITMENGEIMNMIQTDTAINSGNSGGPLFNMYGQVIGITTAKYSSSGSSSSASIEGIGFAIPINDVKDMVKDIISNGYVTGKPNVGILMNDVSSEAVQYGVPAGAYVEAILSGSCAEKAGLKEKDIITGVDDTAVTSSSQLASAVKNYKAKDSVTFKVYRDGQYLDIPVTLDEANKDREQAMSKLQEDYQLAQSQKNQNNYQSNQNGGSFFWPFGW